MSWFSSAPNKNKPNWNKLTEASQVDDMLTSDKISLIFKHSTRCSISAMALNRFEKSWENNEDVNIYFLDLINDRAVSNYVAEKLNVIHQSPQVIVLKNSEVVYHDSHNAISVDDILKSINQ